MSEGMLEGTSEGTADGVSEGTIDGKSDVVAVSTRSLPAAVLVDRVDPLFLLSLEFFVGIITAHRTATVITMIAIDLFVVQAIVPFAVPSVFSIDKL
jgi:hypothetical protein